MTDTVIYTDAGDWDLANRVRDSAQASESIYLGGSHYHITVIDTAVATEEALARRPLLVGVSAVATEQFSFQQIETDGVAFPAQVGAASETVLVKKKQTVTITDGATARETTTPVFLVTVNTPAVAALTVGLVRPVTIDSAGVAAATLIGLRKQVLTVTDGADADSATGGALAPLLAKVSESANASAQVVKRVRATNTVNAAGVFATTLKLVTTIIVKDHAAITAALSARGVFHVTAADEAEAEEYVRVPSDTVPNLFVNTHLGAAAQWSGLPLDSIIEADGLLYGAGPAGLYTLANGVDDDAGPVEWAVTWDLDDFGSRQKKRLDSIYVAAACAGPFTVRLAVEQARVDLTTRLPRNAKATNHRAQAPQGLEAVYWRVGLRGSKDFGADHVIVDYRLVARSIT